jgi:hypothetical protein
MGQSCAPVGAQRLLRFTVRAVYERIGFRPKRRYSWVEIEAGMDQVIGAAVAAIIVRIQNWVARPVSNRSSAFSQSSRL